MSSLVVLTYNPYMPQLAILINGAQPPDFSRLVQYTDEDIWKWVYEIFDTIYAEIRDEFEINFVGTSLDAKVIQVAVKKCEHCIRCNISGFSVAESMQQRMGKLNQLIIKAGITAYKKTVIDAVFMVPPAFQEYLEDISAIDINNLFCAVRVQTIGLKTSYSDSENSVLFILADSVESGQHYIMRNCLKKPAFVLILGADNTDFHEMNAMGWFINTNYDDIFNIIFNCFMQMPLLTAFRKCLYSIKGGNKITKDLQRISCVEPIIQISVDKAVEVGKSVKMLITLDPPIDNKPKLIYKIRNQKLASCDGISVYGIQEGICVLEVYYAGSKKPFFTKEIQIYKRNRITRLLLSDTSLLMGIDDNKKIICEYYPENADNSDTIQWKSSDEKIVQVDSEGRLLAIASGTCRILCTAENISSQCICTVRPYLKSINIKGEFVKNNELMLEQFQEIELSIELIPQDCFDGELTVGSSNSDIVNVVNHTLYAKNSGEAMITISNCSGRISRSFNAVVDKKHAKKKSGFFSSLFK